MVKNVTERTRVRRNRHQIELQMLVTQKRLFFLLMFLHFEFFISPKRLFFLL